MLIRYTLPTSNLQAGYDQQSYSSAPAYGGTITALRRICFNLWSCRWDCACPAVPASLCCTPTFSNAARLHCPASDHYSCKLSPFGDCSASIWGTSNFSARIWTVSSRPEAICDSDCLRATSHQSSWLCPTGSTGILSDATSTAWLCSAIPAGAATTSSPAAGLW